MSSDNRPTMRDEAPLGVVLSENFDGLRVQVIVAVSAARLARSRPSTLLAGSFAEEHALDKAHQHLHGYARTALEMLRSQGNLAVRVYTDQALAADASTAASEAQP